MKPPVAHLDHLATSARRLCRPPHLLTFAVGAAAAWTLLAAISISSEQWYWWPVLPLLCSVATLAVRRSTTRPRRSATGANPLRRLRITGLLLIAVLAAGPIATHVYWLLGGTWGLHTGGVRDEVASTGVRLVAALVIVLLVAAVLVVLAAAGFWRQRLVSERMIRLFTWMLAAVFVLEAVAAFSWSREDEWWLYGPASFAIALLASTVAASGGGRPRLHRPHRTMPSH